MMSRRALNICLSCTAYELNENDVAPLYVATNPVGIAQSREDRSTPVVTPSLISGSSDGAVPPVTAQYTEVLR